MQQAYTNIRNEVLRAGSPLPEWVLPEWNQVRDELETVQAHREYWKPKKTRIVLLAESHVKTSNDEAGIELDYQGNIPQGIPNHYVRLVYCLGYGESRICGNNAPHNNSGTIQFWKIFQATQERIENNQDTAWLLHSNNFNHRIDRKNTLLQSMRDKGIWLVDASLPALYHPSRKQAKLSQLTRAGMIRASWKYWTGPLLRALNPERIIVIGCGVNKALCNNLYNQHGGCINVIPQPQAHVYGGYIACLQTIRRICVAHE